MSPHSDWIGQCRFPWPLHCRVVAQFRAISIPCGSLPVVGLWTMASMTILDALGQGPLIFNLGHGITPDAPVSHVEQMVNRVRQATIRT